MKRDRRESSKKYRQENKEKIRQSKANSYQKHRAEQILKSRQYHAEHRAESNSKRRLYYREHKDELLAKQRNYKNKEYYQEHRESIIASRRKSAERLKIEVLTYYGNGKFACIICGESRFPTLSLDHINGDGAYQRKLGQGGGVKLYLLLKKLSYPKGYQTLCMNCQWIKKYENREYSNMKPERVLA